MFQGPDDHEFESGMKLEAVNPQQPGQICVATITGVFDNRLLKFYIDHQMSPAASPSSFYYYTIDSHDLFPIGWCESNQYQLKTPVMRSLPMTDKSASRKVAVVQPQCVCLLIRSFHADDFCFKERVGVVVVATFLTSR